MNSLVDNRHRGVSGTSRRFLTIAAIRLAFGSWSSILVLRAIEDGAMLAFANGWHGGKGKLATIGNGVFAGHTQGGFGGSVSCIAYATREPIALILGR